MGYRWVILAAGTFAQSSFAAASVGLPALAPALRSHYALSLGRTGVVLAATGIGMLFTLLPWGLLADRFDERLVIATGLSGAGVVLVLCGTTTSFVSLTLALIGAGALGASVNAASGRAIMSWFGASELGLALGIRQTAIPIGGALGAGVLPVLASTGGTRLAFFVLGGSCMTGALVAATFIRPGRARVPELTDVTRPLHESRLWLRSPTAWARGCGRCARLASRSWLRPRQSQRSSTGRSRRSFLRSRSRACSAWRGTGSRPLQRRRRRERHGRALHSAYSRRCSASWLQGSHPCSLWSSAPPPGASHL